MATALCYGDSITAPTYPSRESGYTGAQAASGMWADQVCAARGWERLNATPNVPYAAAIGGTCLTPGVGAANLQPFAGATAFWERAGQWPVAHLIALYGVNDYLARVTAAQWAGAWDACYAMAGRMLAPPKITVCCLPLVVPNPDYQQAGMMDGTTATKAQQHGAALVTFDGMTAAMLGADGIHPNADGHAFIAARVLAAL